MHICIACDVVEDMTMFEEPQCYTCGSTMYDIRHKMKILVACEYSGRVREAFRDQGHDAISCDLLPTEIEGPHYQGDVRDILFDDWDMIIAFPPCTYLSRAGARWMYPKGQLSLKRYEKAKEAKDFFMLFYNHPCEKICIENTIQMKIMNMPQHSQTIHPYMFGQPYSKNTLLWLKGLPLLQPTKIISSYTPWVQSSKHRGKYQAPTNLFLKDGKEEQAKARNRTFEGIANAMADQWSYYESKQLNLFTYEAEQ